MKAFGIAQGYELMDLGLVNLINTDVGKPYTSDS